MSHAVSREQQLIDFCSSDFPYVCTGAKTTAANGAVSCACGNTTIPTEPAVSTDTPAAV
ncbi:hypothetical protein ACOI1H_13465 [Loktanella sp. DJP18]|uniref:hypothetical protein n=1 Tax=Loktanella sp. DJP18 TaxID=3409788 RepID=UPI003BB56D2E